MGNGLQAEFDDIFAQNETQKQSQEYMASQLQNQSETIERMELENKEKTKQYESMVSELSELRQFKHTAQQQQVEAMMEAEKQRNELEQIKKQQTETQNALDSEMA